MAWYHRLFPWIRRRPIDQIIDSQPPPPVLQPQASTESIRDMLIQLAKQESVEQIIQGLKDLSALVDRTPSSPDTTKIESRLDRLMEVLAIQKDFQIAEEISLNGIGALPEENGPETRGVQVYLDPDQQIELRVINPRNPTTYAARIFLSHSYALLRILTPTSYEPSYQRVALHLHRQHTPYVLLAIIEKLWQTPLYATMWVVRLSRMEDGSTRATQWQGAAQEAERGKRGSMHRPGDKETVNYSDDYIFYFAGNAHPESVIAD